MPVVMTRPYFVGGSDPLGPQLMWEQLMGNPISQNLGIVDIDYDTITGRYAALTNDFGVVYTDDGVTWNAAPTPLAGIDLSGYITWGLERILYGGGQWIAVGRLLASGPTTTFLILTSPDAVTWTQQTAGSDSVNGTLSDIAYDGSGMYVAVGGDFNPIQQPRVYSSPDGVTWTARSTSLGVMRAMAIAYGNGIFTICGGNNTQGRIATSPDGITWTTYGTLFNSFFTDVAYEPTSTFFTAVSPNGEVGEVGIITSTDNWSSHTQNLIDEISFVVAGNNTVVAVTNTGDDAYTSADGGLTWSSIINLPVYLSGLNNIKYAGGYFNYVANSSLVTQSVDGTTGFYAIMKARELTRTAAEVGGVGISLFGTTGSNNESVELGRASTSGDEQWSWSGTDISTVFPDVNGGDTPMVWAQDRFVLLKQSMNNPPESQIATSSDGATWTAREIGNSFDVNVNAVEYDTVNDVVVAVGYTSVNEAGLISSNDRGVTWTVRTVPDNEPDLYLPIAAVSNTGRFLIAGNLPDFLTGYVATSTDGATWTRQTDIPNFQPSSAAYGNGRFIIQGYDATTFEPAIAISTNNGASFNVTVPSELTSHQVNRVVFLDGFFWFTGNDGTDPWIASSYGGTQFTDQIIGAPNVFIPGVAFYQIASDQVRYIVGGSANFIYQTVL